MNYMKQIAELLGVELGEEFKVRCQDGGLSARFYIIDDGLYEQCKDETPLVNSALLRDLLIGRCDKHGAITHIARDTIKEIIKELRRSVKEGYEIAETM